MFSNSGYTPFFSGVLITSQPRRSGILRDQALQRTSFRSQSKAFFFARYYAQPIDRIRDLVTDYELYKFTVYSVLLTLFIRDAGSAHSVHGPSLWLARRFGTLSDSLRDDLCCVGWGVKLYSLIQIRILAETALDICRRHIYLQCAEAFSVLEMFQDDMLYKCTYLLTYLFVLDFRSRELIRIGQMNERTLGLSIAYMRAVIVVTLTMLYGAKSQQLVTAATAPAHETRSFVVECDCRKYAAVFRQITRSSLFVRTIKVGLSLAIVWPAAAAAARFAAPFSAFYAYSQLQSRRRPISQ